MECEFFCLEMRRPPPVLRGLFSKLYPIHCSHTNFLCKPHIVPRPSILQIRFRSSSCAALNDIELSYSSIDTGFRGVKSQQFQSSIGRKKISSKLHGPDSRNLSNLMEKGSKRRVGKNLNGLGAGWVVKLDKREKLKWYSERLNHCAFHVSFNEGKAVHGKLIKSGIDPDMHLWVSLINFYTKCRSLTFACSVFDEVPERDVVSWTAIIGGFVAEGYGSDCIGLFCEMRREGVRPNEFTLATVLKACSMSSDLEVGKQIHVEVIKGGVFSDVYVGSALVDLYAKYGDMEYADKAFLLMPELNAVSWNALLNGYAEMGDGNNVLRLFCGMAGRDMKFSKFTLCTTIKGCANSGNLRAGQVLHSMAIKIGNESNEYISCSLVDMYSKCEVADDALKIFMRIQNPDFVICSTMINCLNKKGRNQEAAELFNLMRQIGSKPSQFTLASLVSVAIDLGDSHYCQSIHACVCKYGFESENVVSNALITMYMNIGSVHDGYQLFNDMSNWDVISWNVLLSGFHDDETCDQGPRIFNCMLLEGFKPNVYTFVSILASCSCLLNVSIGKQVHSHIIKHCLDDDMYVGTALMDMYAKVGCLEDVEVIFNRLNERDLHAWTVMVSGYARTDQGEKAIQCFSQMQREGVKPNEFTLASCLKGSSGTTSLENGRLLHSLAIKTGHLGDIFVASALVDMYGKCGCIDDAETFFKGMNSRDTVLWNTIICGYSLHGEGEKALEAFKIMSDEGASPDRITFIGILSACSHMGLVEEGKEHFRSMSDVYGISPSIDHYTCMVDILGRAGQLSKVENFIQHMKLTPNALIWETLLGACKIHGNIELAERAAERLFEIEPQTDSNYILLSNIFAAKGRWNDVSKIRALMMSRGVKKEPGCSWVEVDGQIHVFVSQDASHSRVHEIYQKLEELEQELISVGYTPNTEFSLHNVCEREKMDNLLHHSERLALAFSLISNIPHKTIRIFKNLRICRDCHEYMKFISSVKNQEIVVRDINLFHHFQNGKCSCKDYW